VKDIITSRGVTFRRPQGDERSEQASIKNLTAQIGGVDYTLGTVRATCCATCGAPNSDPTTRQTPGLADLVLYLPPPVREPDRAWTMVWVECKGRGGTLSEEQLRFRQLNQAAQVRHLVGGLDEYIAFLEPAGWVRNGGAR
jgi:hypothetical protein